MNYYSLWIKFEETNIIFKIENYSKGAYFRTSKILMNTFTFKTFEVHYKMDTLLDSVETLAVMTLANSGVWYHYM